SPNCRNTFQRGRINSMINQPHKELNEKCYFEIHGVDSWCRTCRKAILMNVSARFSWFKRIILASVFVYIYKCSPSVVELSVDTPGVEKVDLKVTDSYGKGKTNIFKYISGQPKAILFKG